MNSSNQLIETMRYRCLVFHDHPADELYLLMCGVEQCVPGKTFYTRGRSGYHLHLILSGQGQLSVDGALTELHSGQLFMTKPDEETWYEPDRKNPWSYCWMAFDGTLAKELSQQAGFPEGSNFCNCHLDHTGFLSHVQQILDHPQMTLSNELTHLGHLLQFIALAVESSNKAQGAVRRSQAQSPETYVSYALELMNNNYAKLKVGDVAEIIGIDRSYLSSIFRQQVGIPPQQYLIETKLKRSAVLLRETELSIQKIAEAVGYDSSMTFSKVFKKTYGTTPSEFRLRRPAEDNK